MNMKKLTATIGLGMGLVLAAGSAQAITYEKWSFQDDDIDFLWRPDTSTADKTDGALVNPSTCVGAACNFVIGDVLISVFEYPTFTIAGNNAIPTGKEVTGVAAIQYQRDITHPVLGAQREYTAFEGGLNAILALGDGLDPTVPGGGVGESAIVATFINNDTTTSGEDRDLVLDKSANLATNCASLADCIDEATKPTLLQVDGGLTWNGTTVVKTDPDNEWVSGTGGGNITAVAGLSEDLIVVNVNAGLSTLYNTVLPIEPQDISGNVNPAVCSHWAADGCIDFRVTATVNGGNGLVNGAFAHSTSIASSKFVAVPEPATLALLGAGLLGMGRFQRRKS